VKTLAILALMILTSVASAEVAPKCDYAGQSYSVGATVCECPGLKAENLNWTGETASIFSRRLACNPQGAWEDYKSPCIDTKMGADALKTYNRWMDQYCPRLPVNAAEIQKAISQETTKYIDAARNGAIDLMVETICKRYRIEAPCKLMLDAINGSTEQH
jgi:hypothetical protein